LPLDSSTARLVVVVLAAGAALSSMARAEEAPEALTLEQAVAMALEHNPALQAETEKANAEVARAKLIRAALLPRLDVSEGLTRSDDPVYVFGTLLRQGRFTAANFELDALNFPSPLTSWQTRVDARAPLFDLDGYLRTAGARRLQSAAELQTEQERQDLLFRVIGSYYGVEVAKESLEASREALKTAESNESRIGDMVAAGSVVRSDLLSAQVFRAQMQERVIRAENALALGRMVLGHELGLGPDAEPEVAGTLGEPAALLMTLEEYEQAALSERPGLTAAMMQHEAASEGRRAAKAAFAPRLDAFASWQREADQESGEAGSNWTVGVQLGLNLFSGGAHRYRLAEASARERQADAEGRWMRSAVQMEVRRCFQEMRSAEQRAAVARASVEQARESLRIVQDRHQTGLATLTDLLSAETSHLEARTASLEALHDWQVARAQLERAAGKLTKDSTIVRGGRP